MKIPSALQLEFTGGSQKDWIIYDKNLTRLFCIAIWQQPRGKWVLGEYVNIHGKDKVLKALEKGYMTMLEAARHRTSYRYEIARHDFHLNSDVILNPYWHSLIPDLRADMELVSLNTPIHLSTFLKEMERIVLPSDVVWSNIRKGE